MNVFGLFVLYDDYDVWSILIISDLRFKKSLQFSFRLENKYPN